MALALQPAPGARVGLRAAMRTPPLALRRLTLGDFRSYRSLRLETGPRPVVLTGPNGAGKTNLLEAISFLAPGRGLRRARLAEVDRIDGGGPWSVKARLEGPGGQTDLATGRVEDGERERRLVRIDNASVPSQAALAEVAGVVWLTPAMDRLFSEGAGPRRRFLDRLVLVGAPAFAGQMSSYSQALRERARLLREGRGEPAWLGALESRAAAAGVAIAAARRHALRGLAGALAEAPGWLPQPELALLGEVEAWLDELPALDAEARLAEALAAQRRQDAESGQTAIGPHRSDLLVRERQSGRPAGDCSTGEQKALLIAIVLAEARLRAAEGERQPILLLDEVAAHLDPERRAALFEELAALGAQAWLTGTEAAVFAPFGERAQFFSVRDSRLHRHDPVKSSAS
jgi:DNA replication and repair protein RecF